MSLAATIKSTLEDLSISLVFVVFSKNVIQTKILISSCFTALDDFQPEIYVFLPFKSFFLLGTSNLVLFIFSLASLCAIAVTKVMPTEEISGGGRGRG